MPRKAPVVRLPSPQQMKISSPPHRQRSG